MALKIEVFEKIVIKNTYKVNNLKNQNFNKCMIIKEKTFNYSDQHTR